MNKVLIVVDYQNDFITGALGFPKAELLVTGIVKKIESYKAQKHDVIYTMDTHNSNYLQTQEGRLLPIKHCIKGTHGIYLHPAIDHLRTENDKVFSKQSFGSLELGNYLKKNKYDAIELIGLVTNMCVLSNAVIAKAALPEAVIRVDGTLCASFDDHLHEQTLDVMRSMQMFVI